LEKGAGSSYRRVPSEKKLCRNVSCVGKDLRMARLVPLSTTLKAVLPYLPLNDWMAKHCTTE